MSRLPSGKLFTGTTFKPAMAADLGDVSALKSDGQRRLTYRRVRSMCANGDETDIPVTLTARFVVGRDDTQTRVFSGSPRIWL